MICCDTSVLVAAFAPWHEHHALAIGAIERSTRLVAHVALETLSVLTRMPEPYRAAGPLVVQFLDSWYPDRPLTLTSAQSQRLLTTLVGPGVSAGAVYDGLVAVTAATHDHRLLSLDRRAADTYRRLGTDHELLG